MTGGSTASGGAATPTGGAVGSGGSSNGSGGTTHAGGATSCAGMQPGSTPATGTVGVWTNVTPAGIDFTAAIHDNFGIQDILVDPARPTDMYAFVCRYGVWKSTDYGATFAKVSTGAHGADLESGKPWGAGIDTNACRDPNTPPTLYTFAGAGVMGFWRSTDGGVNWTSSTTLPDQPNNDYDSDVYDVNVDPYDGRHVIVGYHEKPGLIESSDGGDTWRIVPPPDAGISVYPFFIDTGDPATTRTTWLTISQAISGGLNRTTDAGVTWKRVESLEHGHGASQIFQAGRGVIYVPGSYGSGGSGIYKSADFGATWKFVGNGSVYTMVGTPKHLYASGPFAGSWIGADRSNDTKWSPIEVPAGIQSGWKGAAVSFDGTHHVIVTGDWTSGIWRYIEP